jgi:hypothetical protein
MRSWIMDFYNTYKSRTGRDIVIYTSPSWWNTCTGSWTGMYTKSPLWVAHWGVSTPTEPAGWAQYSTWTFWQYTNCGRIPGIGGCVDRDRFIGRRLARFTIPRPPASEAAPAISGKPVEGSTLSASVGTWSGARPLSYSYQWRRCAPEGTACTPIADAVASTYQLGAADVGQKLVVAVTARNQGGSSRATSAPLGPVQLADVTPPAAAMVAPGRVLLRKATMTVAWAGNDDGSGVASFRVRFRAAGPTGAFGGYVVERRATMSTSLELQGTPGRDLLLFGTRHRPRRQPICVVGRTLRGRSAGRRCPDSLPGLVPQRGRARLRRELLGVVHQGCDAELG